MSLELAGRVCDLDLPTRTKAVLWSICDQAGEDRITIDPITVSHIAWSWSIDIRTVETEIRQLIDADILLGSAGDYRIELGNAKKQIPFTDYHNRNVDPQNIYRPSVR